MTYTETKHENLIHWMIFDKGRRYRIGELELFIDKDGAKWLNRIYLNEDFRPNGGAAKIFLHAQTIHGKIFLSYADKGSHKRANLENDCRYLEPPDGVRFANNLFKHKVVTFENFNNPFPQEPIHWSRDYFPFLFQ